GTRKVTSKKDFFFTRLKYSRLMINNILCMADKLASSGVCNLVNKNIVHGRNNFSYLVYFNFRYNIQQYVIQRIIMLYTNSNSMIIDCFFLFYYLEQGCLQKAWDDAVLFLKINDIHLVLVRTFYFPDWTVQYFLRFIDQCDVIAKFFY